MTPRRLIALLGVACWLAAWIDINQHRPRAAVWLVEVLGLIAGVVAWITAARPSRLTLMASTWLIVFTFAVRGIAAIAWGRDLDGVPWAISAWLAWIVLTRWAMVWAAHTLFNPRPLESTN